MNHHSRTRGAPSSLSESILQQINMYALAATSAGVGLLALAQPAESKVVYTKAHKVMGTQSLVELDLNHDGISDFLFYQACSGGHVVCLFVHDSVDGSKIWSSKGINGQSYAAALRAGVRIGPSLKRPSRKPPKGGLDMAFYTCTSLGCAHGGPWYNV